MTNPATLSMMDWPKPGDFVTWQEDRVSTAALWWELNVSLGRLAGTSLGQELYYEVRYESLVGRPAEECAALCAFLGVPYSDAMLPVQCLTSGQLVSGRVRP